MLFNLILLSPSGITIIFFATKTKSKTTLLQRIRNTASSFSIDSVDEEEGKRNVFLLDTEDVFFQDLSCTDAIQDLISCSEEQGRIAGYTAGQI